MVQGAVVVKCYSRKKNVFTKNIFVFMSMIRFKEGSWQHRQLTTPLQRARSFDFCDRDTHFGPLETTSFAPRVSFKAKSTMILSRSVQTSRSSLPFESVITPALARDSSIASPSSRFFSPAA